MERAIECRQEEVKRKTAAVAGHRSPVTVGRFFTTRALAASRSSSPPVTEARGGGRLRRRHLVSAWNCCLRGAGRRLAPLVAMVDADRHFPQWFSQSWLVGFPVKVTAKWLEPERLPRRLWTTMWMPVAASTTSSSSGLCHHEGRKMDCAETLGRRIYAALPPNGEMEILLKWNRQESCPLY